MLGIGWFIGVLVALAVISYLWGRNGWHDTDELVTFCTVTILMWPVAIPVIAIAAALAILVAFICSTLHDIGEKHRNKKKEIRVCQSKSVS